MKFNDTKEFVKLGYFSLDESNNLILKDGLVDSIIDSHTHLAWSYFFGKPVDLDRASPKVRHFFPEDNHSLDLSHYSAHDFNQESKKICQQETVKPVWDTKGIISDHTIPNMLAEMKRFKVSHSVILAIDYPAFSHNSDTLLDALADHDNLICFSFLHQFTMGKEKKLKRYLEKGSRGIKHHPPLQLIKPGNRLNYPIYELARKYNQPVLFHCGYSPLMPSWQQRFTTISSYRKAIEDFKDVTFILGHSGIDDYEEAAKIGRDNDNVYLELSGQPPGAISKIIEIMGYERVLYGTDWPFYPMSIPLAKVLIATENMPKEREHILSLNARRLFAI